MSQPPAYVHSLLVTYPLVEPINRLAVAALALPPGSRGLDAGCGIGLQAMLLAEAVGPAGHVTGLDLSPEHVTCAQGKVEEAGLAGRISFRVGDVRQLPFADGAFDWAWSEDCVAHVPDFGLEAVPVLRELCRVVRPGGIVAILSWTSQMLLPGYPVLEANLNATRAGIAPFTAGSRPEWHFTRALGWLREAGLVDCSVLTLAASASAPLPAELRSALVELIRQRWAGAEPELSPEDAAEFSRLCLPESPDCILDHPDYYAFWTYSLFRGRRAAPAIPVRPGK